MTVLLALGASFALAKEWQVIQLKSFNVLQEALLLQSGSEYGLALRDTSIELTSRETILETKVTFADNEYEQSEVYLVFGSCNGNGKRLWAGGYSKPQQRIIFAEVELLQPDSADSAINISLHEIAAKSVDIVLPFKSPLKTEAKFYLDSEKLSIEINGVPLRVKKPAGIEEVTCYGYLLRGGTAQFKNLIIFRR